jgi:hypothetical protein
VTTSARQHGRREHEEIGWAGGGRKAGGLTRGGLGGVEKVVPTGGAAEVRVRGGPMRRLRAGTEAAGRGPTRERG